MNRLVIIGNGFDMAHGLKTSYKDFINWYWDQIRDKCCFLNNARYEDVLLRITLCNTKDYFNLSHFFSYNFDLWKTVFDNGVSHRIWKFSGLELFSAFEEQGVCTINKSALFEKISHSIETKGWVDIENDYYSILKDIIKNPNYGLSVEELNDQMRFLQDKLVEYLTTLDKDNYKQNLLEAMIDFFNPADFSTGGREKAFENIGIDNAEIDVNRASHEERNKLIPKQIMLLSFNYTNVAKRYNNFNIAHNYIHGDLEHPHNIIFGYGDELDKDFKDIVERNENDLLKNVKSVKYLETDNYRKMLNFIESEPFQVFIMGHSCGNSDRTLLNTIFEHKNCVSIKPFYYKREDGTDNYLELVQNIYRNFTDLKLYRDRVVNKTQCLTM